MIRILYFSFAIFLISSGGAGAWSLLGPTNYDDCILEKMKGVTDNLAAGAIMRACASKFSGSTTPAAEGCKLRPLTASEFSKLTFNGGFKPYNQNSFEVEIYNGNREITVNTMVVKITEDRKKTSQLYKMTFDHPVEPMSKYDAYTSTMAHQGSLTWTVDSIQTCSK